MDLLKEAGCPLKIERGERVFPVSDHASDIIAALERTLKKKGVKVQLGTTVKNIFAKKWMRDRRRTGTESEDGR